MFEQTSLPRHDIAFINGNLADLETLIAGMRPGIEIVVLDPARDGLAQIAAALAGRTGLDAIHLIGHGASGLLQLGDVRLDAAYLRAHADVLADIGAALGPDGDILVYGCETGAGPAGGAFLNTLASLTGADTAASDDASGGTLAGGDWQLERSVGAVETASAMTGAVAESYLSTLALSAGAVHTYSQNTWAYSCMAQDASGNVYLAHKVDGSAISIKKWTGTAWTEITKLTTAMTGDTYFSDYLSLQVDASGNIDLLFQHNKVTNADYVGSTRGIKFGEFNITSQTWTTAAVEQASHPSGWRNFSDPTLTITPDGKLHAVYNFNDGSVTPAQYKIQYATSSDNGASWTNSTVITTTSAIDELHNPTLFTDSAGTVHLFYVKEDNQNDLYGNLYYTSKASGSGTWTTATKIASDLASDFTVATDGAGKFYIGHTEQAYDSSGNLLNSKLHVVANDTGSWVDSTLQYSDARAIYKMEYAGGKLHMLVSQSPLDGSQSNFMLMRKDGASWTAGYLGAAQLPSLSLSTATDYFDEGTFTVTQSGQILVVTESGELKSIKFTAGSAGDYGLSTNAAPVVSDLNGDVTSFTPGDGGYIDQQDSSSQPVGVTDADSADFSGGTLTIARSAGTADGHFLFDFAGSGILGFGASSAALGATIHAGDKLFSKVAGVWTEIGQVDSTLDGQAGRNLKISFSGTNATPAAAEELVKYLMFDAPTAGSRTFSLTLTDGDGGTSTPASFGMSGLDVVAPTVTNVTSSTANGTYKAGATISIQVQFSEAVTVTGVPTLNLGGGGVASYTSGSGSATLTFSYTVGASDTSTDLDFASTSALKLNGGTIKDAAGNAADLALATPGSTGSLGANKAIVVDGIAPTDIALSNAAITTQDGTHAVVGTLSSTDATTQDSFTYTLVSGTGSTDNASFEIASGVLRALDAGQLTEGTKSVRVRTTDAAGNTYEEALSIAVTSAPTVAISASPVSLHAGGTSVVTFTFSKPPVGFELADIAATGGSLSNLAVDPLNNKVYTATFTPDAVQNLSAAISVAAGKFKDAGGLDNLASTTNAAIGGDTLAPTVTAVSASSANGTYKLGDIITLRVTFSEAVTVSGQPTLQLETGATDRNATYTSGSGSTVLTFSYTVQAGDLSGDLDVNGTTALQLNGGTIRDAIGNDASLTLPAPGNAGSLGANKAIVVDGVAPTDIALSNAAITTADGTHAVVGTLGSTDGTPQDSFAYTLVSGAGSTDNASFEIVGGVLRALDAGQLTDGTKSVRVRTTDAAGNTYEEALSISVSSHPTVAISAAQTSLGVGGSTVVTFTFSTAPVGFELADITATGGSLANLTVDPLNNKVYTATFTPDTGVQNLAAAISVGAGKFTDAGGLGNLASSTNAAIGGDTLAPSVVIGSDRTTFKAGQTATITFTFSETPSGFDSSDIVVTGGTLSGLAASSDSKVYTATFTPSVDVETLSGAIAVTGASYTDARGNAGSAGVALAIGGDTDAPVVNDVNIDIAGASGANGAFVAGDVVTVTWNDSNAGDANPDTAAVSVDFSAFGGPAAVAATRTNNTWSASWQLAAGTIDATGRNVTLTVTDDAGNSTTRADGSNATVDIQAPVVSSGAISLAGASGTGGAYRVGDTVTATWNNASDGNADVAGAKFDFSQFGGGVVAASASGNSWSASYTIVAATIDAGNRNVTASVTDDAGVTTARGGASNVTVDAILPHATAIAVANNPGPNATSIDFTVVFDEAVTGVDLGDFTLATTGATTGTLGSISGSGTTRTVSVTGISGNGTLGLVLKTGGTGITDNAGNVATNGYSAGAVHTAAFNAAPVISSNSGGATAAFGVAEKQQAVTTVVATDADADPVSYSITGGADAALFTIDAATGVLRFLATPLRASAGDADHDNVYQVTVSAADNHGATDTQALSVTVLADLDGDGSADVNDDDIDNDGRPNSIEDPVPGALGVTGDGNGDGIADRAQLNVASLPTVVAGAPYATLEVAPGLTLTSVSALPPAGGLPRTVKMPVGQFGFTIGDVTPGGTVQMSIYVDSAQKVNGYFKKDASGNWVNLASSVTTVGTKTKITFALTDGGVFDSDGAVNGSIADPGGLVSIGPVITSNGGQPAAALSVTEGKAVVTTVQAGTGASYAITGGADAALFHIDAATGVLSFIQAPSSGDPHDVGRDNVYDVQVTASDGFGSDTQALAVGVVAAPPPPTQSAVIDGVSVGNGTRNNADGTTSQVITIPVITPTRDETVGHNDVADIPLATSGGAPVLTAQVPVGVGVQVTGDSAPTSVADAVTNLIREIKGVTVAGSSDQMQMTGGGSGFLDSLPANANLLVQTVVPTVASATATAAPLVIQGTAPEAGKPLAALVIDAHQLPAGSVIQLQNVDFAAIVGDVEVTGGAGRQTVWGDGGRQTIFLGEDDDVLHGGAGNDIVGSAGGNDKVYGDDGDDVVFGGLGDDLIDGGTGIDTVRLVGSGRADYTARYDNGHLVLTHRNGGADGTDTIANVEILRFTGAPADTSARGSIGRLYEALLGRAPDAAGVENWMAALGKGTSLVDVARHMLANTEAQQQGLGDAAFVSALYMRSLGRSIDDAGLAFWTNALSTGKLDRATLALTVADSAEKLAKPVTVEQSVGSTDIGALVRMYATLFDRAPDNAGMNLWLSLSEAGASLDRIADYFISSDEAVAAYAKLDNHTFAQALYHKGMHRAGTDVEVGYWTSLLDSGKLDRGDVLLQFAQSAELVGLVGVISTSLDGAPSV